MAVKKRNGSDRVSAFCCVVALRLRRRMHSRRCEYIFIVPVTRQFVSGGRPCSDVGGPASNTTIARIMLD